MNQDKIVFTAVDWLASILMAGIAIGTIHYVVHDMQDSKQQRAYFNGYTDGVFDMAKYKQAARKQKHLSNSSKESK